jgi:hypothetical protein
MGVIAQDRLQPFGVQGGKEELDVILAKPDGFPIELLDVGTRALEHSVDHMGVDEDA